MFYWSNSQLSKFLKFPSLFTGRHPDRRLLPLLPLDRRQQAVEAVHHQDRDELHHGAVAGGRLRLLHRPVGALGRGVRAQLPAADRRGDQGGQGEAAAALSERGRVSMVSLTGQIFGTGHPKDRSRPVKTNQESVNWKWSDKQEAEFILGADVASRKYRIPSSSFWGLSQI